MKYELVQSKSDLRQVYRNLQKLGKEGESISARIGYLGGHIDRTIYWHQSKGIWVLFPPRNWDVFVPRFGVKKPQSRQDSLSITCQVNFSPHVKYPGAGLVLRHGRDLWLAHSGRVGGGRQGISKTEFLNDYSGQVVSVARNGKEIEAILISHTRDPGFLTRIADFVFAVDEFKRRSGGTELNRQIDQDARVASKEGAYNPSSPSQTRRKVFRTINLRRGQPEFRKKLLSAYGNRCAISNCNCVEALEAAHIRAYVKGGENHVQNGLLLRSDLHVLFDTGRLGVCPDTLTVIVSPVIADSVYGIFHGKPLKRPEKESDWPNQVVLKQHLRR